MIKPLVIMAISLATGGISFADSAVGNAYEGIYGSGIELTGTGSGAANAGVTTLYALNQTDNGDLLPPGSTATVSSQFADGTDAAPVFSLGTFIAGSSTLTLNGGSLLTYSGNGASQVAGAQDINYQIEDSAISYYSGFSTLSLSTGTPGSGGNEQFSTEGLSTNLLAGLAPGTYTINIYNSSGYAGGNGTQVDGNGVAIPTSGTTYDSNNSADYGATFTVVSAAPEPGTVPLMVSAFVGLAFLVRRRLMNV